MDVRKISVEEFREMYEFLLSRSDFEIPLNASQLRIDNYFNYGNPGNCPVTRRINQAREDGFEDAGCGRNGCVKCWKAMAEWYFGISDFWQLQL